jgi:ankyrin repeat protein
MGEPPINVDLWYATLSGNTALVRNILDEGADIESQGLDGDTPLLSAIKRSVECSQNDETPPNNELVEFLLKREADVSALDRYGRSAIHICARGGSVTQLMLLLEHKADINQKTRIGQKNSPLHICSISGHVEFAKCLVRHGADIDSLNIKHRTPLMEAVAASYMPLMNLEIVKYFIEEGVNLLFRGLDGQTAESLSIDNDREDLTEVIKAAILIKETCMAFAFGSIHRLAEGSVVDQIDPLVMRMILHRVLYENEQQ